MTHRGHAQCGKVYNRQKGGYDPARQPGGTASMPAKAHAAVAPLMPQPGSLDYGDGWLHGKAGFSVEWLGYHNSMLDRAVLRFQNDLARRTNVDFGDPGAVQLRINCRGEDDARERYSLTVKDDVVLLTADGPVGVLRGLATLRQAITNVPGGFAIPAMVIDDAPRFLWRGLMIDVARHFYSLPTLKRQIDAMELVKLNVLHLHLSDNEGFRVESRLYPKLHEGSSPEFYSQIEIRELVSYAADRGVRIVPEFDVPGHSLGMLRAYPEFASGDLEGRDYFSAMGSALNPAKPETFAFLDRLFGEMAALFPDQYFHIGGDEISGADWKANPQVQDFMKANGLKTLGSSSPISSSACERASLLTARKWSAGRRLRGPRSRMMSSSSPGAARAPSPE
jgi:hexosaminidase